MKVSEIRSLPLPERSNTNHYVSSLRAGPLCSTTPPTPITEQTRSKYLLAHRLPRILHVISFIIPTPGNTTLWCQQKTYQKTIQAHGQSKFWLMKLTQRRRTYHLICSEVSDGGTEDRQEALEG